MDCQYLSLSATGQFSPLFLDYVAKKESLTAFYNHYPTIEGFNAQIREKHYPIKYRETLVSALERQYSHLEHKPDLAQLGDPNTFTVTTGHQLNIFTGPLYIIYKLITVINLAKKLKQVYPDYNFVPIYWMATEDHDFPEINHFSLFGRNHHWDTTQKGAVGRMNPKELETLFGQIPEKLSLFEDAYLNHDTLSDAVRYYMNELFGAEGLICIDGDDKDLKHLFAPVMREELTNQLSATLVEQRTDQLKELGYSPVITPRDINLFYLDDQLRERITFDDGIYRVLHTNLTFSHEEIHSLLDKHPERFSPNVVLRPVYQETILPNLAYIGGPSEVPYWLQLKGVFDHFQLAFPLLIPRNFAMYVPAVTAKRMQKLGFTPQEWFMDEIKLKRQYVETHTAHALKFDRENKIMHQALDGILHKAQVVDPTLEKAVLAETKRFANAVARLEKKLRRAEERNQQVGVDQLLAVKHALFPSGSPQERSENFLTFYLNDKTFLRKLLNTFDPLDFRMQICLEK